jgi:glutamine amidotransferase
VIAVLDYGIGNLRSAQKALERSAGAGRVRLTSTAAEAEGATGVVLPGVGAFGRCMEALHQSGLDAVARRAIDDGVPFLGVCIGMQMLYEGSDEDPGVPGLGILPGHVRRLAAGVKHPQMQWNQLAVGRPDCPLLAGVDDGAWVYFVHSYAPETSGDVVATCDYGGSVVAMVERGPIWATQFHPEKSSSVGLSILANFVAVCGQAA